MPKTRKFLQAVADYLLASSLDHRHTTLIFPNKRSTLFMRRYLKRRSRGACFMPRMRTIGAFFSSFSDLTEASRIQQLFTLYDAFCEVSYDHGQNPSAFDRFRFWGEMILDDFDDIDRQLATADDVFHNVKSLEEIRTDFLDEDQRKVAKELWGYDPASFEGFKSNYHRKGDDDLVYDGFVTLSEMLGPIYRRFHELLREQGLTTRGMTARIAAESIESAVDRPGALPERIGFVGFGVISHAERKVFKILRNSGHAEFFWDVPDMLERDLADNMRRYRSPLAKYIARLVDYFPMPEGFALPPVSDAPAIEIISVPANVFQAKVAGNILEKLQKEGELNPGRADGTAVVMPDPSLLIPMLHSTRVSPVNVTMGLPIRHTPFATLLSLIIRLNMSGRIDRTGEVVYLTENVVRILSHPSLSVLAPEETSKLRSYLARKGRFVTSYNLINEQAPGISFVFRPVEGNAGASEARDFIVGLIDNLLNMLKGGTDDENESIDNTRLHEYKVLEAMKKAVENLVEVINQHPDYLNIDAINKMSFFHLIEKQLFKEQLNLSGSPLTGVQIMGTLETRALDFDNVVMLSMNEKTFPPKNFVKSLIPAAIRAGYGLTTVEQRELEYAWIYANLMSRCRRAYLIYDASSETKGNGGMSRYLFQTRYIFNRTKPSVVNILPSGTIEKPRAISIEKTPEIMAELRRFLDGGDRHLSVSALEKFGECPLKFYLSKVKKIPEPKRTDEAIDDATIGSMVHQVLQDIYADIIKNHDGVMSADVSISHEDVEYRVAADLNRRWYFDRFTDFDALPAEAKMQIGLWSRKIYSIIETERQRGPYRVECCEMSPENITGLKSFVWTLRPGLSVKFTFFIDRVDRLGPDLLRFIDYKTGSDKLVVNGMNSLFWRETEGRNPVPNKAIFQLLTYCYAYKALMESIGTPYDGDIRIEITRVLEPDASIGKDLKIGSQTFNSFQSPAVADFYDNLTRLVSDIFDETKPFVQTDDIDRCMYCQFKNVCQRYPQKKF